MALTLKQTQHITELSTVLYDFLPANPHPYGNQKFSFGSCAQQTGLKGYWTGGSKKPAIMALLSNVLTYASDRFCLLLINIVNTSLAYRSSKGNPIMRVEIEKLNEIVREIGYKIPELWDQAFLNSLPVMEVKQSKEAVDNREAAVSTLSALLGQFIALSKLQPQQRGFEFEKFLNALFDLEGLKPRSAFRIVGEQIDGSFEIDGNTYLVEAKWQTKPTSQDDLLIFNGKIEGKATWSRGLFISYGGYSSDGLKAFAIGKRTNIIGMDAQDLFFILDGRMNLADALRLKTRRAAETNSFFVSVFSLVN